MLNRIIRNVCKRAECVCYAFPPCLIVDYCDLNQVLFNTVHSFNQTTLKILLNKFTCVYACVLESS